MLRVTLDSNAIIDIEDNRPPASAVRSFHDLHRAGLIKLCVSNIVAGERDRDGLSEPDYKKFESKLVATGLSEVELLNPPWHWGITFWDRCIWAEESDNLESQIRHVLFPSSPDHFVALQGETPGERAKRIAKGNNQLCDVLGMWCHIRYGGDVFVTSDKNFLKLRKPDLVALGAREILRPDDALHFVRENIAVRHAGRR